MGINRFYLNLTNHVTQIRHKQTRKLRFGMVDCELGLTQSFEENSDNFQMILSGVTINDDIINVSFTSTKTGNNIVNSREGNFPSRLFSVQARSRKQRAPRWGNTIGYTRFCQSLYKERFSYYDSGTVIAVGTLPPMFLSLFPTGS